MSSIGSSRPDTMLRVPSASENSSSSVRSMRTLGNAPISPTTISSVAATERRPMPENKNLALVICSLLLVCFLDFNNDCTRNEPCADKYGKEQHVAEVQYAFGDRIIVCQEPHR